MSIVSKTKENGVEEGVVIYKKTAQYKYVGKPNHRRRPHTCSLMGYSLIRNRLKVGTWSPGFVLVCKLSCHLSWPTQ